MPLDQQLQQKKIDGCIEIDKFNSFNSFFCKIFKSNNANTIAQCLNFCHILPFPALYDHIRSSFLLNYYKSNVLNQTNSLNSDDFDEISNLIAKYNFDICDSPACRKFKIWSL